MENGNGNGNGIGIVSKEKLDQAALWLSATVSSAFFASLERFSCVNLNTADDDDDDNEDEAKERPLTQAHQSENNAGNLPV